jgi:hypothetical protein
MASSSLGTGLAADDHVQRGLDAQKHAAGAACRLRRAGKIGG